MLIYDVTTDERRPIRQEDWDAAERAKAAVAMFQQALPVLRQLSLDIVNGRRHIIDLAEVIKFWDDYHAAPKLTASAQCLNRMLIEWCEEGETDG